MPICPKCHQNIPQSDVEPGGDIVWGRCVHCDILFRVLPEDLKRRPPEAEFTISHGNGSLDVSGTVRGLLRSVTYHLSFSETEWSYEWKSYPFSSRIHAPRERLQSVEPLGEDVAPGRRPRGGYGILLAFWHVPKRGKSQPKTRTLRIPVRTLPEQFWLLNEICGFLDRTTRYPSMFLKYRAKEYFGNETLEMFFESRTICMRIFCPKCGAGIPGRSIDIRAGRARCPRRYCQNGFSWQEIFEAPIVEEEPRPARMPSTVAGYGELSDIRAVHFAANANPLLSVPFGSEPPSTAPLPTPFFDRLCILRKSGELSIAVDAVGHSLISSICAFGQCALAVILPVPLLALASLGPPPEFETVQEWAVLYFMLALWGMMIGIASVSIVRSALSRLHSQWGRWALRVKNGVINYRRRCGPLRKSAAVPFDAVMEVGAKIVARPWLGQTCESFTPHQIHIRYNGKKTLVIPCNNADEQLWILGELYESLRKRS